MVLGSHSRNLILIFIDKYPLCSIKLRYKEIINIFFESEILHTAKPTRMHILCVVEKKNVKKERAYPTVLQKKHGF